MLRITPYEPDAETIRRTWQGERRDMFYSPIYRPQPEQARWPVGLVVAGIVLGAMAVTIWQLLA